MGAFPKDRNKHSGSKNSSTYVRRHFLKRDRNNVKQLVHPSRGSSVNKVDVTAPCFVLVLTEKQKGRRRERRQEGLSVTSKGFICLEGGGVHWALGFKHMAPLGTIQILWVWSQLFYGCCLYLSPWCVSHILYNVTFTVSLSAHAVSFLLMTKQTEEC